MPCIAPFSMFVDNHDAGTFPILREKIRRFRLPFVHCPLNNFGQLARLNRFISFFYRQLNFQHHSHE
jgi:hypothetical protein